MSLPLGASPRVNRDYRQFGQSPLSQPFQSASAVAMAQAGERIFFEINFGFECFEMKLCYLRSN